MPSYVVAGASRGIGLEFVRQLSLDKKNLVFALARNPQNSAKLVELEMASSNVHALKADLDDAATIKAAAAEVAKATGGSLDYLINNGAYTTNGYYNISITDFPSESALEKEFLTAFRTNVLGVTHSINAFLPLLRKGTTKKVISLSTGHAATDVVLNSGFVGNVQSAVSKAALNMVVAEFATRLRAEGFTFLALSPGVVNTSEHAPTEEEIKVFRQMVVQFQKHQPSWDGVPLTPERSVQLMLNVIEKAEPRDTGAFISQYGNQTWM